MIKWPWHQRSGEQLPAVRDIARPVVGLAMVAGAVGCQRTPMPGPGDAVASAEIRLASPVANSTIISDAATGDTLTTIVGVATAPAVIESIIAVTPRSGARSNSTNVAGRSIA